MDENLYQGCHTFLQVWSSNANGNDSPSITFLLFATKFPAKRNAMIFNYDVRMSVSISMSTTTLTMTQLQYLIIYSSLLRNELFISTNAKFHCTISYLPSPKAVSNQGEFHSRVPPSEPLTTKGVSFPQIPLIATCS